MSQSSWIRSRSLFSSPAPKVNKAPSQFSIGTIGRFILRFLKRLCIFIGAFFLVVIVLISFSASRMQKQAAPTLPREMVLSLDMNGSYPETAAVDEYSALLNIGKPQHMSIDDVIDALNQATHDKKVKALVVKTSGAGYDVSQIQQIRAAVKTFRASGKKAYITSESYGEGGHGLSLYYLASAFDEIWMQPVGAVTIGGINLETPYFKALMDKYGVQAQFFHRKEYKNAMEHLTADHMSAPSREMMGGLVNELADQLVVPIKADRKKVAAKFDELLDLGLVTDIKARDVGLIDKLDYEDRLLDKLQTAYKDSGLVPLDEYWASHQKARVEAHFVSNAPANVAVVHVNGLILSSSFDSSPVGMGDEVAGADDIAGAIRDAAEDANIKAIVLRVNSPGGSPIASETIHRAVEWAMTVKKKPVIVSMGSVAASGGYWISAGANKIYAMDGTLTGSIGVVGGKINLQDLWKKFDVNWDNVKYGQNAGLMSFNTPFSPSEQKQFEASLDSIYATFIDHVAKGRHLTMEKAESVAKGHVWTGRQAVKLGLVDEIGGMDKVLDDIAKKQGLSGRDKLQIVHLPAAQSPIEMVLQMLSAQSSLAPTLKNMGVLSQLQGAHALVLDTTSLGYMH